MNSQATFQRMMDPIFSRMNNVRCYVDGVVVFSENVKEYLKYLENVLAILKENGLRFRIKN